VHVLSPGMMLTDLLLEGASDANKQVGPRGGCVATARRRTSNSGLAPPAARVPEVWMPRRFQQTRSAAGPPRPGRRQVFNILCEHPETVAAYLIPRLRTAVARGQGGSYTRYLTPASAAWRFLTAPARVGRFFDASGAPVYPPERERILGAGAAATRRAQAAAAARGGALRAAYSLSVAAASVAVVMADAAAKAAGQ
jgi:hypothetical protein